MKHKVTVPSEHKELTAINALALSNEIEKAPSKDELVIDMCNVQYISAAGIGVIADACRTFKQVYVVNTSEKVLNILSVLGIDKYAKFEENGRERSSTNDEEDNA